jgi:hypothetical protein
MKAFFRERLFVAIFVFIFVPVAAFAGGIERDPVALRDWRIDFSKLERADNRPIGLVPNAVPSAASHFVTMVPCRVFDTRLANGPYGGPAFAAEETRTFDIPNGPCSGIPSNAIAYSFNIAVTQTLGPGFVTAWPTGVSRPTASSLNYQTAPDATYAISNGIIIPAGTSASVDVFSKAAGHVIVDINGYFTEGVVTDLTAGAGLSGGGTGAVTVDIEAKGVTPAMLDTTGSSAGNVLTSDGTDASWQAPASANGTAGGDLSGTYPNPTIASTAGDNIITAVNGGTGSINGARLPGSIAYDDAANVFTAGNTFNLGLSANNAAITSVATPTNGTDAANKSYVDTAVTGAAGGDLSGTYPNPTIASTAGDNIITAVNGGTGTVNAARLPGSIAYLNGTNGFTGSNTFNLGLSANSAAITNVATPANGTDAANKSYVDSTVSGITSFVKLSPATVQTTTSTNDSINVKVDRTGNALGTSGTTDLLSLSAAGNYNATPLDKERFRVDNAGSVLAIGGDDATIPATGAGTRMMFHAFKGAFRVGQVTGSQWDDSNIGQHSFAAGRNTIAKAQNSAAFGSDVTADAQESFAAGDTVTASGKASIALGTDATASHKGTFVFGDQSSGTTLTSSANNQFLVRAAGGTTIYSNGALTAGVTLASGGGSWSSVSDYHRKENFIPVNGEEVLQHIRSIPISTWNYKSQDASIRHLGPMAQDLYSAFGVGEDEKLINTIDIDGVNLAGVQALEARTVAQQNEIDALKARNSKLEERLQRLEGLLAQEVKQPR